MSYGSAGQTGKLEARTRMTPIPPAAPTATRPGSASRRGPLMLSEHITSGFRKCETIFLDEPIVDGLLGSIRQVNISDEMRIWRDFAFGDLVSVVGKRLIPCIPHRVQLRQADTGLQLWIPGNTTETSPISRLPSQTRTTLEPSPLNSILLGQLRVLCRRSGCLILWMLVMLRVSSGECF